MFCAKCAKCCVLQQNALSLSIISGKMNVMAVVNGRRTPLESMLASYTDGWWHYVTISNDGIQ